MSLAGLEAALAGAAIDLGADDTVATDLWPGAAVSTVNEWVGLADRLSVGSRALDLGGNRPVIVYFANGKQKRQSSWQKALDRAVAERLSILFVTIVTEIESTFAEMRMHLNGKQRRPALPAINVDGSDVVAVYRAASEAIAHARKGNGPTLIECIVEDGQDPIEKMTHYLRERGFSLGLVAGV